MTTWTHDNTEGFTDEQLEVLNDAQSRLEAKNPDADPQNIADHLNNAFVPGITVEQLVEGFSKTKQ